MLPHEKPTILQALNHVIPLLVHLIEFFFNCVPFVPRHYIIFTFGCLGWILFTSLEKHNHPDSSLFSWSESEVGIMVPILVIPIGWILHHFLTYINKKKMQMNHKTDAYEQLEAMYEDLRLRKLAKKRLDSNHDILNSHE